MFLRMAHLSNMHVDLLLFMLFIFSHCLFSCHAVNFVFTANRQFFCFFDFLGCGAKGVGFGEFGKFYMLGIYSILFYIFGE